MADFKKGDRVRIRTRNPRRGPPTGTVVSAGKHCWVRRDGMKSAVVYLREQLELCDGPPPTLPERPEQAAATLVLQALAKAQGQGDIQCADLPVSQAMKVLAIHVLGESESQRIFDEAVPKRRSKA